MIRKQPQRSSLAIAVFAAMVSMSALPAMAQDAGQAGKEEAKTLDALVVTAQKREEAMQDVPITVEFTADARGETWRRDFAGTRMQSRLAFKDGLLHERIGPLQFRHALLANAGAIWWRVAGVRLFGLLPLPARWFRGVRCCERGDEARYRFDVEARLPLVGQVIRYEGWLLPVDDAAG